jgi:hypothetical protein
MAAGAARTTKAIKLNKAIYQVQGNRSTYLVVTPEGNIIIDTSTLDQAPAHKKALNAISAAPVKYII